MWICEIYSVFCPLDKRWILVRFSIMEYAHCGEHNDNLVWISKTGCLWQFNGICKHILSKNIFK